MFNFKYLQKLGQLTLDEEQQHQSISGNDNEQDNIQYFEGDNSENPWKKAQQGQTQIEQVVVIPQPVKPAIYVPKFQEVPIVSLKRKFNTNLLVQFLIFSK